MEDKVVPGKRATSKKHLHKPRGCENKTPWPGGHPWRRWLQRRGISGHQKQLLDIRWVTFVGALLRLRPHLEPMKVFLQV